MNQHVFVFKFTFCLKNKKLCSSINIYAPSESFFQLRRFFSLHNFFSISDSGMFIFITTGNFVYRTTYVAIYRPFLKLPAIREVIKNILKKSDKAKYFSTSFKTRSVLRYKKVFSACRPWHTYRAAWKSCPWINVVLLPGRQCQKADMNSQG